MRAKLVNPLLRTPVVRAATNTFFAPVGPSTLKCVNGNDDGDCTKRQRTAQIVVALGCLIVLVGSVLHLAGGYPIISAALAKSNLDDGIRNALRAVFLMIGITWIIVALVTLIATFIRSRISKLVTLLCGLALLLQVPIWVNLMGWFVGNEMFLIGAALMVSGELLFRN